MRKELIDQIEKLETEVNTPKEEEQYSITLSLTKSEITKIKNLLKSN